MRRDDARERARQRAKERNEHAGAGGGGGNNTVSLPEGVGFLKIDEGQCMLKVLAFTSTKSHVLEVPPVEKGEIWWRLRYKIHRNVGPNNESIVCPTTVNKPCPICEERVHLFAEKKKEEAKKLFPSWRNLILVEGETQGSIAVLDISEYAFLEQLKKDMKTAEDDGLVDVQTFYWPTGAGYDLRCRFDKESYGEGRSYLKCSRVDFKKREAVDSDLFAAASVVNIQECLNLKTYNQVQALFLGIEEGEGDSKEEEKEQPSTRKPQAPAPVAEEEPEQGDDLDEMDEEGLLDLIDGLDLSVSPKALRKMDEDGLRELIRDSRAKKEEAPTPVKKKKEEVKKAPAPGSKPSTRKDSPKKGSCPHGHVFGKDTDEKDDCAECESWSECLDAKEG